MSGHVVINRESSLNYRARAFKVFVDGQHVDDIRNGQRVTLDVPAGAHRIQLKIDFYKSAELPVEVNEGQAVQLLCGPPKGVDGILRAFQTTDYLTLRPLEAGAAGRVSQESDRDEPRPTRSPDSTKGDAVAPGTIFISYRRSDSEYVIGRIYDQLTQHFGHDAVFKDVDSIPLGVDFREHLDQALADCRVFIEVIGSTWLNATSNTGKRRLDSPTDHVRIEIEVALKRKIPVIPLLIHGIEIPDPDALPESIRDLAFRNGMPLRPDPDFQRDIERLTASIAATVR